MIYHRARVYRQGSISGEMEFDMLGKAVSFCNSMATKGDHCEVTEVILSLTGEEELSTIAAWDREEEEV